MNLLVFQLKGNGLLELVSEPAADDEDEVVVSIMIPERLPEAA